MRWYLGLKFGGRVKSVKVQKLWRVGTPTLMEKRSKGRKGESLDHKTQFPRQRTRVDSDGRQALRVFFLCRPRTERAPGMHARDQRTDNSHFYIAGADLDDRPQSIWRPSPGRTIQAQSRAFEAGTLRNDLSVGCTVNRWRKTSPRRENTAYITSFASRIAAESPRVFPWTLAAPRCCSVRSLS